MRQANDIVGTRAWMCLVCGFMYYEEEGLPEDGIPPGTRLEAMPDTWRCPACAVCKSEFVIVAL